MKINDFLNNLFILIMKKLKELNNLHSIFVESINILDGQLQTQLKNIKLEYQQNVTDEKIKLLEAICKGEGLDLNKIKSKYLKPKEIAKLSNKATAHILNIPINEEMLDTIIIDNIRYYYDAKENGTVYNEKSLVVGKFIGGKVIFD